MIKYYFIFIFQLLYLLVTSQPSNNKLLVKEYIKANEIIFRIAPSTMEFFNIMKVKGILVEKTELGGSNYTEVIKLFAYHKADTTNWMKLIRHDKNKTAFIYQALYNNSQGSNTSTKEKEQNIKMLYDMILLSCDLDKETAKACGLYFKDSSINNSKKYSYRFSIYTTGQNTQTLTTYAVNANELSSDKPINTLKGKGKFNKANLQWNSKELENNYSGYNIERSTDNVTFIKLNKTPVILLTSQFEKNKSQIFFEDTMPVSNTTYYYRVKGINFFGEESKASNVIKITSHKPILSVPIIDTITSKNNKHISIRWRMENANENEFPESYILLRSLKDNGTYSLVASGKKLMAYLDTNPMESNYYKVGAITKSNDTIYSFTRGISLIDEIPPSTPSGFSGASDKSGKITLKWNKNNESDLQGYKIYRSNSLNEEFVQVNDAFILDSFFVFKPSLNNLTRRIYFKLSASDNNYNTSPRTQAITILKADTIKPASPNLLYLSSKLKGVECKFIKSQSDDIMRHEIQRKERGENSFITIRKILNYDTCSFHLDTSAVLEKQYEYSIVAIDSSDNFSRSTIIPVYFENGFREKIKDINSSVDRAKKHIILNWKYQKSNIEKFIIYRGKDNEPLTIIKTIEGTESNFTDKTPNIGNIYEYRIKAVMTNGAESIISDKILIEF